MAFFQRWFGSFQRDVGVRIVDDRYFVSPSRKGTREPLYCDSITTKAERRIKRRGKAETHRCLALDDLGIILTLLAFLGIPVFAIWFVNFRQRPRPERAEDCRR